MHTKRLANENEEQFASANRVAVVLFTLTMFVMLGLCHIGGRFGYIGEWPLTFSGLWGVLPEFSVPSGKFILLFGMTWVGCIGALFMYPRRVYVRQGRYLIFTLALIARLVLLPHVHSDDMNRYLWEGKILQAGINPYHIAPDDPSLESFAVNDPYFDEINHPFNPAAYPPLILYLFAGLIQISYTPLIIKIAMICFDLGTLIFLFLLLSDRKLDLRWSIIYAFNPVVLYSFAGQGHFDAVQCFFLSAALYFFFRKKWVYMYVCMGLAVQSKYIAIIVLPFLINRRNIKFSVFFFVSALIFYLPLIDENWPQLFFCLLKFAHSYAFDGSIHAFLRWLLGGIAPATAVCKWGFVALFGAGVIYFHPAWNERFKDDPVPGAFYAIGLLLLLSPTIHFWYLTWIIPCLVLRPSVSWLILCGSISGYFVTNGIMHHSGRWELPFYAHMLQWAPFYLFFFNDIRLFLHRWRAPADPMAPRTVSVVIPTLNEAVSIESCITALKHDPVVSEIIVVDGDSTDTTPECAADLGARVIIHGAPPENGGGRGGQIYQGVQAATGDVVAIVHADTRVAQNGFSHTLAILRGHPSIVGGAIGSVFDDSDFRFRLLELANDFRAVFMGSSFGDQVQFFRRQPVIKANAFPNIPLMEDVEFSLRLQKLGRQIFLFGNNTVSARKWHAAGFGQGRHILARFCLYIVQRIWKKPDTLALYRSYYNVPK